MKIPLKSLVAPVPKHQNTRQFLTTYMALSKLADIFPKK